MNIGLFTDTYFPQINGVGTSVHMLSEELTAMGHNVYIFTPSDPHRGHNEKYAMLYNKVIQNRSFVFSEKDFGNKNP